LLIEPVKGLVNVRIFEIQQIIVMLDVIPACFAIPALVRARDNRHHLEWFRARITARMAVSGMPKKTMMPAPWIPGDDSGYALPRHQLVIKGLADIHRHPQYFRQ